jgi:hypothetical protein
MSFVNKNLIENEVDFILSWELFQGTTEGKE